MAITTSTLARDFQRAERRRRIQAVLLVLPLLVFLKVNRAGPRPVAHVEME